MSSEPATETHRVDDELRVLALVDRIIGLEAEVSRLSIDAGIKDIRTLQKSRPWRVGMVVLAPVRLVRKILRRS